MRYCGIGGKSHSPFQFHSQSQCSLLLGWRSTSAEFLYSTVASCLYPFNHNSKVLFSKLKNVRDLWASNDSSVRCVARNFWVQGKFLQIRVQILNSSDKLNYIWTGFNILTRKNKRYKIWFLFLYNLLDLHFLEVMK